MSKKVYGSIQFMDKIQKGELRIDQVLSHYDYMALSRFISVNGWDDLPSVLKKIEGRLQDIKSCGRFENEGIYILKGIETNLVQLIKGSEND